MYSEIACLPAVFSLLALSACGGQSGNEGEIPAAPCAGDSAFVIGHLEEVGGGCVSVRVERIVAAGMPLLAADGGLRSNSNPVVGKIVRGRLATVYAYDHEFERNESVAVFVEPWSEETIALQLFPFERDRVHIHWAGQRLVLELDEMSAVDCRSKLEARREASDDERHGGTGTGQTSLPEPDPMCSPDAAE